MKKTTYLFYILFWGFISYTNAQTIKLTTSDSICGYKKILDNKGKLLGGYKPEIPGASYVETAKRASEFKKSGTPVDSATKAKLYYISCCFQGPHMRDPKDYAKGKTWENWMNNPACVFAGMVQSLVLDYRVYSGDTSYTAIVREMCVPSQSKIDYLKPKISINET